MGCIKARDAVKGHAEMLARKAAKPTSTIRDHGAKFSGSEVTGSGKDARKMRRTEQKPK